MPIHVAITRRVRAGCETEFQDALREFLKDSFSHANVLGASMLTPPPGSNAREYGILRTFASEADRAAFYQSPMFRAWDERARALTEGDAQYRQLHGLEAWFRSPGGAPPPRWKMAVVTLLGVYPTSMLLALTIGPWVKGLPFLPGNLIFAAVMVAALTWAVMPLVTRLLHTWLHSE